MTLLQFIAVIAAILILMCLFLWNVGKSTDNNWKDGQ